jgi:uncharacterized repeat protein (TIGR03803 family)
MGKVRKGSRLTLHVRRGGRATMITGSKIFQSPEQKSHRDRRYGPRVRQPSYQIEPLERRLLLAGYSTLISFTGTSGADPGQNSNSTEYGAPITDSSGNLYGVTAAGGTNSNGVLYELAAGATSITILHTFSALTSSDNTDGAEPLGNLLLENGVLYGTCFEGGTSGVGTIFDYNLGSSTFATLCDIAPDDSSGAPQGGLIMDSSGDLLGTTKTGGTYGDGSIFELTYSAGSGYATAISILYSFSANTGGDNPDGKNPYGGVIMDSNGDLFGTARAGGTVGDGTIWELPYTAGSGYATATTTLYIFTGSTDGKQPDSNLAFDSSDDLIGTTQQGGANGKGDIYELAKSGGSYSTTLTTLYSFTGSGGSGTGEYAWGAPVVDSKGDIFGTDQTQGAHSDGIVWELPNGATAVTVMHAFSGGTTDGSTTYSGLYLDNEGNLWGTTCSGGASSDGTIFEITSQNVLSFAAQPGTAGAGTLPAINIDVKDTYGNLLTGDTTSVTLSVGSGPGSLTGTTTVAVANGVATFSNAALDTLGTYTLTASDGSDTSATSSSFTIDIGSSTQVAFSTQPSNLTAGNADSPSIVVDLEDGAGLLVTTDDSNVTLSVNTGGGSVTGTATVAAVNGVATFSNVILTVAGAHTLLASDGSLTTAVSNSFTVSPASASQLAFEQEPDSTTAGNTISPSVTVAVEDQYGNIVTSNSSNVTLAKNSGPGSVNGTLTEAASNGVATFANLSINTSGTYTLSASDGSLTGATSSSFTISAAASNKLAYGVQPSNVTAGSADSPSIVVDVEDQYGNIVTSDSSNVTLAINSGPGSIGGTDTVAAFNGVAAFSNVVLDTTGSYTLAASDGSLTGANSNSFTVSAASANKLAFNQQPSNATAGNNNSPAITVDVEDQYGNVVTSDSSSVTLAVNSGPGSIGGTDTVSASNGVATFSAVVFDTVGSYTITASDGSYTTATSNSFTISAASANKLAYSVEPSNVTAGVADSPSIVLDVEDQYGNIVTANSSNVTLTINSGPGSIGGTDTVAASNGVATFSNVVIDTAGSYTLLASDGSLTTATSSSFTVSHTSASQVAFNQQPSNVTAGSAISPSITVDVEDQYGNVVTSDSSTVVLSINSGPGSIGGTDSVSASNGVATFSNVKIDTAGSYTLAASDGSLTGADSSSFTVSAASASQLAFNQEPTNVTAGSAISPSITVDVEDQYGNIVTSNSSNVTLSVNTGPGSIGGTDTVAASNGVATLNNVKLDTAGSYTLLASDGSLTTATSSSFTVSHASASQVAFNQEPSNVTAGSAISPSITVDVEDQYGNVVTSDSSTVVLSINSGPGSIGGTDSVSASNGVATFSNVKLDTAGSYTLLASDGSLTTATSSSFTVSHTSASQVAFNQEPSNVTAGSAISPSITVDVEDQYGNVVTSDSSSVVLSINTGPGSIGGTDSVSASNGVATFSNVKLNTAGTYTLAASDGSLTGADSTSFIVSAATASQVVFNQEPSNITAGSAISPSITVDVEDQYGNIVTTDGSSVTLSIHTGPGSIGGTDSVNASNGVATFSNVKLDTAGSYTLLASDGSLTTATSSSFTVSYASASQVAFNQEPSNVTAGSAISPSITVDVEDQYGNIVTSDSSSVTLSINSGPGSIGGTDSVSASNGVATFSNVKLNTVGTYTLAASDGSLTGADSTSFVVSAASASQLAFNQGPSNVTAGSAISPSITVDVEDQYGNVVTTDSSTVVLSINSGPGSIGGTDSVSASNGVATFSNVKLDTAGAYTLAASDGSLTGADSSSFTVSPTSASQLAFNQEPSNVTAGSAISPSITVDVEDQYGNIVTTDSSSVTLSIHSGPGSIGGTDSVSASNGVATFSNVKLDTAGTYTLAASDGSLTAADSTSFVVSAATASQLAFNQEPSNVVAGSADSPAIVVDVEDQYGNIVISDSSSVTLSVNTGPGNIGGTDSVNASNGVATFSNVTLDTAGNYTLAASDGSLTGANSNSFSVDLAGASQLVFNQEPSNVTAGNAISPSITVDIEDPYGNIVSSNTSNVTLSINSGPGSIGGTDTVAAVNGVATFNNVKLDTAGAYTLAASDGGLTGADSTSFTVSPAAASQVVFNQEPSNVTAGSAISPSITVDVEDQFGNIVASDSSNVTLSVNTGPGSIGGTDTVSASNGVATFSNVVLDTAGSYTLLASDGSLSTAISSSFTVTHASASQVAFNQEPSNVTAGNAISPNITVDVEDQYGNVVTNDSSNVTLSVNSGPGSIGGTDTVAASNGVATFSNIILDTAGTDTLAAADGSLSGATSGSFVVGAAAASQLAFNQQPTNVTAGSAISPSITVDVEDQYGNIITTDSSNVTLSVNSGPGSIGGTDTVAAVNGVATFSNVALDTAGSYTLLASDGSLSTATSSSFTVTHTTASELAFSQQPSNVTAGNAISPGITVDVEDQYGNIVTSDSSNVTLSVNTGPGSLGGMDTVAASNGVATFSNVKLDTAGAYTLAASDGSLTGEDSNSFVVNPATASQIVFNQQPSNVAAGSAISPSVTVDVEDQYGNIVTSDSSNVTLSVNTGPGSIGGTDTVAASNGVATFSNVKLDTTGTYTLAASDGGLAGADSNSFVVSPATASQVVFNQQPSNVTAGSAISPSIAVDVEDQYGNIIATDSSNVTLSLNTGPGSIGGTDTVAAVNGVATFSNVVLDTAGSYTLLASDGSLSTATSSSFTVTHASASELAFSQQPSNVTAGSAIAPSITVDVEDQYGNIITSDSSSVTLSVNTGSGSIGGTDTVAASNGVATFSNVKLDTAGTYTLAASDGSLTGADSSSFVVNPTTASQIAFNQQPSNVAAGSAISPSVTVDVEDQYGNIVTTDGSSVTLSINTGPGSIGGTAVNASNGVATFSNVKLDTVGTYTLAAADGSLTGADSSSFTVSPALASQVVFNQEPSNVTAGNAISPSITVDVEDAYGNVVTADSSNVTLSVNTGPGSIGGTDTVAASNGVATFSNVVLDTAGTYTLAASDGSLTGADSTSFIVNPAAANQVAFNQEPSDVGAGSANNPAITVDVEDQYGNVVTTDSSSVTLSINTGPGAIGGTDTVTASNGIATFNDIVLNTTGTYTLAASDGILTGADSTSFVVGIASASKLAFIQQPSDVTAGDADAPVITVEVEDQYGNIVNTDNSSVTLSINSGPGTIGGTDTIQASNGIATFSNVILDTAGSYTLAASDGGLTATDSSSFTVSPAGASKLIFIQEPSNVTAGSPISPSITVHVEDQYGNVITSDSSNVTLSVNTGPGAIGGTDTVAAANGIAIFNNIKLDTAGTYTLAATDSGLSGADSSSFTVNPVGASQVVFNQQPSNAAAGSAIAPSITVDVEDQYGNVITSDSSNVTLSIHTGPGSIGGTDTVAAANGIATFSNVILDTAGTYTLAASDSGLTGANSSSFTISPTGASKLAFNQQPSNGSAGSAITPSITVNVEDQFGNLVTSDTSDVTLSVHTGPGSIGGTDTVAASGGVTTFNDVLLDTAGNYTLAAGDGILADATSNSFTISTTSATKLVFAIQPSNVTAGIADSPSIVVDIEDQFGNIVTSDNSNVTLTVATGAGSLSGTTTVTAINGVATFSNAILDTAGGHTLLTTDGLLASATSNNFTVNPAAASQLVYATQPGNVSAGSPMTPSIVIDVEDQFGNIVAGNSSNVTLAIHTGPGSIGGTDTVAASNGVATFSNVILDTAGNYTLAATDTGLTGVDSNEFTVNPGSASELVFNQQPSNSTAQVTVNPSITVYVEDAQGNIITSDNSNVTLNVSTGPGSIGGTDTVAASNGMATFSNVSFATAGTYTLAASDGSLTGANSNSFVVSPGNSGNATQLVFLTTPQSTWQFGLVTPGIEVALEDQSGNIVTDDPTTITLSVGPSGSLGGTLTATTVNGIATFSNVYITKPGTFTFGANGADLTASPSTTIQSVPLLAPVHTGALINRTPFDVSYVLQIERYEGNELAQQGQPDEFGKSRPSAAKPTDEIAAVAPPQETILNDKLYAMNPILYSDWFSP